MSSRLLTPGYLTKITVRLTLLVQTLPNLPLVPRGVYS